MMLHATPVLAALDITETLAFYRDKLDFAVIHEASDYGIVRQDTLEIHFWHCKERHIAENTSCRITVTGIDALFEKCTALGIVHSNGTLEDKPWGTREFPILDLNGNLIWFVQDLEMMG
jgi:catechol 2,3-dioxygenase-like lactoylglutathione lyase family enzyme